MEEHILNPTHSSTVKVIRSIFLSQVSHIRKMNDSAHSNVKYKKSKMLYYRTENPKYVTLNQRKTKSTLWKTKCFQIWQCLIFKADNKYSSPGTVAIAGGSNDTGKKRLSMTYRKVTIYLYYSYSHEYFLINIWSLQHK